MASGKSLQISQPSNKGILNHHKEKVKFSFNNSMTSSSLQQNGQPKLTANPRIPTTITSAPKLNGTSSPADGNTSDSSSVKSRLVIKIKDQRKIMYHSVTNKSTTPKPINALNPKLSNGSLQNKLHSTLVPYNDVSSSESENEERNSTQKSSKINGVSHSSKQSHSPKRSNSPKRKSVSPGKSLKSLNIVSPNGPQKVNGTVSPKRKNFEPVFNSTLNATVKVPGQSARLDGVKVSPMLPKQSSPHENGIPNGAVREPKHCATTEWQIEDTTKSEPISPKKTSTGKIQCEVGCFH